MSAIVAQQNNKKMKSDQFYSEYLFMCFQSERGCKFEIQLRFANEVEEGDQKDTTRSKKENPNQAKMFIQRIRDEVKLQISEMYGNPYAIQTFKQEQKDKKREFRQRQKGLQEENIIMRNVEEADRP